VSELRLHVGGEQAKAGWKILDVQAGPGVDFVGTCTDLSGFDDASVAENRVSLNVIAWRN
jgi:predicted SAM-dependent methyltransferase